MKCVDALNVVFKVYNKDTTTMPMMVFWCLDLITVSNFEHVFVYWVTYSKGTIQIILAYNSAAFAIDFKKCNHPTGIA